MKSIFALPCWRPRHHACIRGHRLGAGRERTDRRNRYRSVRRRDHGCNRDFEECGHGCCAYNPDVCDRRLSDKRAGARFLSNHNKFGELQDISAKAEVTVGGHTTVDAKLSVSAETTEVQVVGEGGVAVNTQSQELSQVVDTLAAVPFA